MASRRNYYNFTVQGENSLLEAAGRGRSTADCGRSGTDHVVELQLVIAALNTLPSTTHTRKGWETELVDFFNTDRNLQCMSRSRNQEKGQAVRKFIRSPDEARYLLTTQEKQWIQLIQQHWNGIKRHLLNFADFKAALDGKLARV